MNNYHELWQGLIHAAFLAQSLKHHNSDYI